MNLLTGSMLTAVIAILGVTPSLPPQGASIPYNAPNGLSACLKARPELEINMRVNPYYIGGDFDGDGFTDVAVQVNSVTHQRKGILICLAKRDSFLLGAGNPLPWRTDDWPFDDWMLIRKGTKRLQMSPEIRWDIVVIFNGDGIAELIYWDGHRFVLKGTRRVVIDRQLSE